MEKKDLALSFEHYRDINELSDEDRSLVIKAIEATQSAYAPYSGFSVGAAVLLNNGIVVSGSNQENAAYPSGLCAERVAMFAAGSQHAGTKIKAIAVMATKKNSVSPVPATPCGACRQVIAEYELVHKQNIRILMMAGPDDIIVAENAKSLLPFLFEKNNLK